MEDGVGEEVAGGGGLGGCEGGGGADGTGEVVESINVVGEGE